jgi:hypothetical protein
MSTVTTGSSGATATIADVKFSAPLPNPVGTRDLFDVVVNDPGEILLVPRTELAKALCSMWLHMGPAKIGLVAVHKETNGWHSHLWAYDTEHVVLHFNMGPNLANAYEGESPWYRARGISHEEHEVALKAIEAHRAANAPLPKAKRKRGAR